MIAVLFALSGAVVGALHARLIATAVHGRAAFWSFWGRYLLVACVFAVAALAGEILAAAAGWMVGFVASAVAVYRRLG